MVAHGLSAVGLANFPEGVGTIGHGGELQHLQRAVHVHAVVDRIEGRAALVATPMALNKAGDQAGDASGQARTAKGILKDSGSDDDSLQAGLALGPIGGIGVHDLLHQVPAKRSAVAVPGLRPDVAGEPDHRRFEGGIRWCLAIDLTPMVEGLVEGKVEVRPPDEGQGRVGLA